MDGAFTFSASLPRFRLEPRKLRAATLGFALLVAVSSFGKWVDDSEHASFARLAATTAIAESNVVPPPSVAQDAQAQESALVALDGVELLVGAGSAFDLAGAAALDAAPSPLGISYVEGPSSGPSTVSVATDAEGWGAAVLSASGTCFLVRLQSADEVGYSIGNDCTGEAALTSATGLDW
jgi:hypothetical protein